MAPPKKFHVNIDKLIEVICLHGLPPKRTRGSLIQPNGYWVTIAKDTLNKCKPSQGYVKSVYNYWQLNIKGVQDKVLELLSNEQDDEERTTEKESSNQSSAMQSTSLENNDDAASFKSVSSVDLNVHHDGDIVESTSAVGDDKQRLFCICNVPYDETRVMVMCDFCLHFYHIACVGIDETTANSINTYKCNSCTMKGVDELMYEEETTVDRMIKLASGEVEKEDIHKRLPSLLSTPCSWIEKNLTKSTSATPGANFFLASIPLTTTTYIPSDSWECLNTGNEWHNIILQALGKANPYCSFAFKNKWQKKEGSRKCSSVCFRCTGSCTFADCPVRFKVEIMSFVKSDPPQQLKTSVHFSSKYVKHDKTERRSRWIRSVDRQHIATELKYKSPSTLYNSKFTKLTTAALESGQRDGTGSSPGLSER